MFMSWLDWAIDDPAPANSGYSLLGIPREIDPSLRYGEVIHSVEGWFTYVSPSAVMRSRGNSWGVTIMRSGQVWKHRPRPTFVNWHAGGPAQNIGTDGIEMEGKNQLWTVAQRDSLVLVLKETEVWFGWPPYTKAGPTNRTQENIRRNLLFWGYGSLWEHRWFDFTSCPSGRDDWPWLMPQLAEEDDMPLTPEEIDAVASAVETKMLQHINFLGDLVNGQEVMRKAHANFLGNLVNKQFDELFGEKRLGYIVKLIKGLKASGGLTQEETKDAVKEANREGTG